MKDVRPSRLSLSFPPFMPVWGLKEHSGPTSPLLHSTTNLIKDLLMSPLFSVIVAVVIIWRWFVSARTWDAVLALPLRFSEKRTVCGLLTLSARPASRSLSGFSAWQNSCRERTGGTRRLRRWRWSRRFPSRSGTAGSRWSSCWRDRYLRAGEEAETERAFWFTSTPLQQQQLIPATKPAQALKIWREDWCIQRQQLC